MGTEARIVLYARAQADGERAARAAFSRIAELDEMLSDYRAQSPLRLATDAAPGTPVAIPPDFVRVLSRALALARETDGAFDVTAGPLTDLWRAARKHGALPSAAERCAALGRVGWRHVTLDSARGTVTFARRDMRLDVGGIAKGYAADQAMRTLHEVGVRSALIVFGGEILTGDPPPGERGWRVQVPIAGRSVTGTDTVVWLARGALSTSGDSEQHVVIDRVRYSHVVDVRTGLGLSDRPAVSVFAPTGMDADAFATIATLLQPVARGAFITAHPEARFVGADAGDGGTSIAALRRLRAESCPGA